MLISDRLFIQSEQTRFPSNARCKIHWRRRVARWRFALTTVSISFITLNRPSFSWAIRCCSGFDRNVIVHVTLLGIRRQRVQGLDL